MSELAALEVAISPSEKFREYLATQGMRLTQERAVVVEEVFASHEHFDADQLVENLAHRNDKRRVSRSTVYRTLRMLEAANLLRKVARTDDRDVYEHDYGYPEHDHLICGKCGTLIEFPAERISEFVDEVAAEHNFRVTGHRLEVYGTCESCNRPTQRRHSKLDLL